MSSNLKVNTILPSVGSNIGIGTNGGELNVDGGCKVQVGTALTLGHSIGLQYATQNLHSAGFEINQINASGIVTASHFYGNGANITGVLKNIVEDTSPQLGGDLASNSNDILMAANDRVVFGSDALRVKHTGSHADIENTTGNITIKNDSSSSTEQILIQAKGGEDSIKAIANGAVELYHNNNKRLETTNAGVECTGNLKFTGSGNGIDFSVGAAGASSSNVLDEYEEGAWTPVLTDASSGGGAYVNPPSNMNARYIKIGRLVYLHFGVHAIGGTAAVANFNTSNPIWLKGMPFPCLAQHSKHFVNMGYMPTVIEKNVFANLSRYNTYMDFQYHGHNTSTGAGYQVRWNMIHVSSDAGYGNIAFDLMYETYP